MTRFPIDWGDGLLDGCPEPEQPADNESILLDEVEDQDENKADSGEFYSNLYEVPSQCAENLSNVSVHQSSTLSVESH